MPENIPYIFLSGAAFIVLLAIIAAVRAGEGDRPPDQAPPPEPERYENERGKKAILALTLGLTVLAVAGTFVAANFSGNGAGGSERDNDPAILTFLPVWIAVFVPIMINQKRRRPLSGEKVRTVIFLLGLMALLGVVAFTLAVGRSG